MTKNMASVLTNFVVLVVLAFLNGVDCGVLGGPLHASCRADWTFGVDCTNVKTKLVDQMKEWKGRDNCEKGGEKCLYEVTSVSDGKVEGKHTTPKKAYTDTFTFTLKSCDVAKCCAEGFSESGVWYAHLDYSTNYCNMKNLITGAGLDKIPGFTENTSDSICTQYSSANCDVY